MSCWQQLELSFHLLTNNLTTINSGSLVIRCSSVCLFTVPLNIENDVIEPSRHLWYVFHQPTRRFGLPLCPPKHFGRRLFGSSTPDPVIFTGPVNSCLRMFGGNPEQFRRNVDKDCNAPQLYAMNEQKLAHLGGNARRKLRSFSSQCQAHFKYRTV